MSGRLLAVKNNDPQLKTEQATVDDRYVDSNVELYMTVLVNRHCVGFVRQVRAHSKEARKSRTFLLLFHDALRPGFSEKDFFQA